MSADFPNGDTFSVFICYEAIYAREVRQFANRGAQLLINISNDGWFGTSDAAEQHLRMVRVRAVENRRWIVRDTNSGISASIDPYGNVERVMKRDVRDSADLSLRFSHRQDHLHALWRLVRLDVRRGFRYSVYTHIAKGKISPPGNARAMHHTPWFSKICSTSMKD